MEKYIPKGGAIYFFVGPALVDKFKYDCVAVLPLSLIRMMSSGKLSVQLHLVRHGETEANRDNILVRKYLESYQLNVRQHLTQSFTARTLRLSFD